MGSSTSNFDNSNCITNGPATCDSLREFLQYDDKGNIVYYYRPQDNFMGRNMMNVHDMYDKEIGSIGRILGCSQITYNFYDEYKQLKYYIEEAKNCCTNNYTIYGTDKNIISTITVKFGCSDVTFDEYDKYNTKTKGVIGKRDCSAKTTYYENDPNGNPIFIIRQSYDCGRCKFKIYDQNEKEINLSDKTLFNDGFTNIQKILILLIIFHANPQNS